MTKQDFPFFESIRLFDGVFQLLHLHSHRMEQTMLQRYGEMPPLPLLAYLNRFDFPKEGLYKCRLAYGRIMDIPEFLPYNIKPVNSLKTVDASEIVYHHKYSDRSAINALYALRGPCDDILMVRNGYVADSSYCNIIFSNPEGWFTPDTPLLRGVQRQHLLNKGLIRAAAIRLDDLYIYSGFKLINAMIPLEEAVLLPVGSIIR